MFGPWKFRDAEKSTKSFVFLNFFFFFFFLKLMGLEPNWVQTRNKTFHIPKVSKFHVEKVYLC